MRNVARTRRAWMGALVLLSVPALARIAEAEQRYARAEPAIVDFGDVAPGTSVTRTVEIINLANFPIHIRSLRPSCECTVVDLPHDTQVDTDGAVQLTLTFTATSREGPTEPNVVVLFAERIPPLRIDGKANVNRGIRFETRRAPGPGGSDVDVAHLEGVGGRAFRVLSVSGHEPRTPEGTEGVTDSSPTHDIRIDAPTTGGDAFPGDARWVAIETDDADAPVVVVAAPGAAGDSGPRSWTISEPLTVLGPMTPGKDHVLEMLLTGVRGEPLAAIERIDVDARGAEAGLLGIEPSPSGMTARFFVRAVPGASGIVAASLRVTAQDHTETMDVYGAVAP